MCLLPNIVVSHFFVLLPCPLISTWWAQSTTKLFTAHSLSSVLLIILRNAKHRTWECEARSKNSTSLLISTTWDSSQIFWVQLPLVPISCLSEVGLLARCKQPGILHWLWPKRQNLVDLQITSSWVAERYTDDCLRSQKSLPFYVFPFTGTYLRSG